MSPSTVSLTTIFVIVAMGVAIGFLAGVHRKMDLEQWTVGGRGFGSVLMFLLMAGEVYTTFSFLGASGWAYSRGGPTLYIMAYLTLAYVVSFFILPQIWEVGRKYGMQTQSDFFTTRYGNKYLAGFVCVVGIASFIPYLQLQITGSGEGTDGKGRGAVGTDLLQGLQEPDPGHRAGDRGGSTNARHGQIARILSGNDLCGFSRGGARGQWRPGNSAPLDRTLLQILRPTAFTAALYVIGQ
jgi:hypothetical protein